MDARRLLNESPTVIGMMTSAIESGGSIDTAIRSIAEDGPVNSRELFNGVVRDTDTKGCESLSKGLLDAVSSLPKAASGYGRAVSMAVSASESEDEDETERMLRDAADLALESVKEMGEAYGASLTIPCMTVFGIGIMVPMILMSILPMLGIGGMFGTRMLDQGLVVTITIAIIPSVILAVAVMMRGSNPFLSEDLHPADVRHALPLLSAIPLAIIGLNFFSDVPTVLLLSLAPACVVTVILMAEHMRSENLRHRCEQALMDSVFDMGNRMMSGANFETATVESTRDRKWCSEISRSVSRELALCRGDIQGAIDASISPTSQEVSMVLRSIHLCSDKDNDNAGRLAILLGKQFQNRNAAKKKLDTALKSTTDMMFATSAFFAPLVLGMSVAMLKPLSKISGFVGMESTGAVLAIYLVELSALISILVSNLGCGESIGKIVWRFCMMCPISLLLFVLCSGVSL